MISQQVTDLAVRLLAQASNTTPPGTISITPPSNIPNEPIGEIITRVITWALGVAGFVVVLFLIVGGIMYITSAGDATRTENAKKTLRNAIIGMIFILISVVIVTTINIAITGSSGGATGGATVGTP